MEDDDDREFLLRLIEAVRAKNAKPAPTVEVEVEVEPEKRAAPVTVTVTTVDDDVWPAKKPRYEVD